MKIVAALIALVAAGQIYAQTPKKAPEPPAFDPVSSFQKLVLDSGSEKNWTFVSKNPRNSKWAKRFFSIGEVRYDVKKTDSMINPVVGVVSFPVIIEQSALFDTEDEARSVAEPSLPISLRYSVEGIYHVRDSTWRLHQFTYRDSDPTSSFRGTQFTSDAAKIKSEPHAAINLVLDRWVR